jgi:hypothetical protein
MPIAPPPQLKAGLFGRTIGGPPKPQGAAKPPAATGPKGVRVEHRIGVAAPPDAIWQVIADLPRWSTWNPTYPNAAGEIRIGGTLDLTLALPGAAERQIRPVVLDWVPNDQLHWKLVMMGGLVKTVRYIEIEQLAEASCIVSNGEIFGGFMGPTVVRQIGGTIRRGFLAMNEALKVQAERLAADR